jgi:hypothetical protein
MVVRVVKGPPPNHQVEEVINLEALQVEEFDIEGCIVLRKTDDDNPKTNRTILQFSSAHEAKEHIAVIQPLINRNQRNRVFGLELTFVAERDNSLVPNVVKECIAFLDANGMCMPCDVCKRYIPSHTNASAPVLSS